MSQSMYEKLDFDGQGQGGKREAPDVVQRRLYDICMVFKYKTSKGVRFEEGANDELGGLVLGNPTDKERGKMQMWKQRREAILKSLQNCGLHVFCYYSRDRDEVLVKIGAGAQKLRDTAARMKYKLQLKKQYLNAFAEYRHDFPGRPERQFKDRRVISHIYKTYTEDDLPDSDAIFKTLDKIHIIHHIITSKDKDCAGINVPNLLHQGELKAYFPLHENASLRELSDNKLQWFLMGEDHANKLRDYFGDRIAFYYLFMGFYWKWLVPIAVIGLALQLLDLLARTPDNVTAVPFCILMSVWATFLPYFWRRQEAKYAIGWGTLDLAESLQPCRPEHYGEMLINPVTAQVEPHYPWQKRLKNYILSGAVITFSGSLLVVVVLLLLLAKHSFKHHVPGGTLTFQLLLAIFVETANAVLARLSRWLTRLENHRTQREHETHMLCKVMGFKFLTSYAALYYIAFFKRHAPLFGIEMGCMQGDCFLDLQSQLAMFVFFRLTVSNVLEYMTPKVLLWWRSISGNNQSFLAYLHGAAKLELADMSPAEQQAKKEQYDTFANFDETLVSHGFSTLFAVTSPWVCAATLLGTIVEIYVDMKSLLETKQRPHPMRARNNEPWSTAFDVYGVLAAMTNILLLIFTSAQYESWTLTEKLTLFAYLEHTIILSRIVIQVVFPEVPRNVELLQLKQENMVHRCLENIKVEQNQDFSMFRDRGNDQLQVFEQDFLGEEEDVEPTLSLQESGKTMYNGMMDAVRTGSLRP